MTNTLIITPSLFFKHSKSPHWIWYDLYGDQSKKAELPELTIKLIEGGVIHEEDYVRNLNKKIIDKNLSDKEAQLQTQQYMQQGEDLIYQGIISYEEKGITYKGRPDLLKKINGSSVFGNYHYIPIEIKSSTKCEKSEYKMQLMMYAIILDKIQGTFPKIGLFINKHNKEIQCDLSSKLFIKTNEALQSILNILQGTEPPLKISSESKQTPWFDVLLENAILKKDISLIYKLKSDSLEALRKEGIITLEDMINNEIDNLPKIKSASIETLQRAQKQAASLVNNEIITLSSPKVCDAKTKIYFDIESDPLLKIEYLFGFLILKENHQPIYKYFIAEKPGDEGVMWGNFIKWLGKPSIFSAPLQ